jgi:DNA-binding transcriptional LysR family regulator
MSKNVPVDLLRAFVTVVDLGSYTKAAEALGRTQPAISLQIRRLEDLLGAKLLRLRGRQLTLTDAGIALGPYARQMLRINDDIAGHFRREALAGWIRVGLPTDFANDYLLDAVTQFAAHHPEVRIEARSGLSRDLHDRLAADKLDLAVAIASDDAAPYLVRAWRTRPVWAVPVDRVFPPDRPLPLIRHPDPCEYASRMIAALRRAGRNWRGVYVSSDVAGLQNAVAAGLGVTALTHATLEPGMRIGTEADGLPPLDALQIGLFYKHARLTGAARGLAQVLIGQLDAATVSDDGEAASNLGN